MQEFKIESRYVEGPGGKYQFEAEVPSLFPGIDGHHIIELDRDAEDEMAECIAGFVSGAIHRKDCVVVRQIMVDEPGTENSKKHYLLRIFETKEAMEIEKQLFELEQKHALTRLKLEALEDIIHQIQGLARQGEEVADAQDDSDVDSALERSQPADAFRMSVIETVVQ